MGTLRDGRKDVWLAPLLAALLVSSTPATAQEEGTTDVVFALDVSASMQSRNNFGKVRDRLIEFIENEADLGGHIVVVTFGEKAELVASEKIESAADRAALGPAIAQYADTRDGPGLSGYVRVRRVEPKRRPWDDQAF